MLNRRLLPPVAVTNQTVIANGRTYTAAPGSFLDVADDDSMVLEANGWTFVAFSGPTTARPGNMLTSVPMATPGFRFYDTTLAALAIWDGATWRSPAGASI
jgi:hypothetical protein